MTPSVTLRPAIAADADALIATNLASRSHHAPWAAPFTDRAGFEAWLAATLTGPSLSLVAHEPGTGTVVGTVTLSGIVMGAFRSACLGYHGSVACAGRGLMTQAVRLAVRHGFKAMGLHRVEANIQPDNHRSIALVRRLGFRQEGFSPRYLRIDGAWRDHERWARLADE